MKHKKNKQFFAMLTALGLTLAMAPTAFAADGSELQGSASNVGLCSGVVRVSTGGADSGNSDVQDLTESADTGDSASEAPVDETETDSSSQDQIDEATANSIDEQEMTETVNADTSELQDLINDATGGSTITLDKDYTLTAPVTIEKAITINGNGNTIIYNGTDSALSITATAAVTLENVKINAESSGAYAIALTSAQPDLTVTGCEITAHTRGINMCPDNGCINGKLTVSNSTIRNSQISDYANDTTVGDTRGIALYGVKNSTIDITDSDIKGFGYSINTSADADTNGVRLGGNTYNVANSNIWGWSAFNVWTVKNTFNITNSDLRGISRLDGEDNNFATFVVQNGIYKNDSSNANVVNMTGGSVWAYKYGTASHTGFLESSESITRFNFDLDDESNKVYVYYTAGSSVFSIHDPGETVNVTGLENVKVRTLPVS